MKRFVLVLALVAAPAAAQERTVCQRNAANEMVCTSRPLNQSPERCAGGDWWLVDCSIGEHRAAKARVTLRKTVGEQLGRGDCQGAMQSAVSGGDFELAAQVRQICAG